MRVRFAPSPTGALHLGNARTALVNWLVARRAGGTLVLRIEDTDRERVVEGAVPALLGALRWLGLDWGEGPGVGGDHGPYLQSERSYRTAIQALLEGGHVYHCFIDPETLRRDRRRVQDSGRRFVYPGRGISRREAELRLNAGEPAALRFRAPDQEVRYADGLRGELTATPDEIGDFVIARADGSATYQLAVVVDDHAMAIEHVIRGQDHLPNTPRQILLYRALSWEPPRFTHLPLMLGPDRSRLSKRHGSTSVEQMRAEGILPEALVNYLGLLGWAPEGEEVLRVDELAQLFRLEALSSANAAFDRDKLEWLNQQHLARLDPADLLARARPFLIEAGHEPGAEGSAGAWWIEALALVAPSVRRLDEIPARLRPLLSAPDATPSAADAELLDAFAAASDAGALVDADGFRAAARAIAHRTGRKGRELFGPLRLALTGQEHGPELARLVPLLEGAAGAGVARVRGVADRLRARESVDE